MMSKRDLALGFAIGSGRRAPETHNHVIINQQPHDAADAARLPKGGDMSEWPVDLQVRQMPPTGMLEAA